MNPNIAIKQSIWLMRRKMKKLGCKMRVAYQLGKNGKYEQVIIKFDYDSDAASM